MSRHELDPDIYYELPNGELTKDKKIIDELISAINPPKCRKVGS